MSRKPTARTHASIEPEHAVRNVGMRLGWFSVGLGLAEALAPATVARLAGLHGLEGIVRLYGLREIVTGIGIMAARERSLPMRPWIWGRVAGDAVDAATLLAALRRPHAARLRLGCALAVVAAAMVMDLQATQRLRPPPRSARDYSRRTGFPRAPEAMRGVAREAARGPATLTVSEARH